MLKFRPDFAIVWTVFRESNPFGTAKAYDIYLDEMKTLGIYGITASSFTPNSCYTFDLERKIAYDVPLPSLLHARRVINLESVKNIESYGCKFLNPWKVQYLTGNKLMITYPNSPPSWKVESVEQVSKLLSIHGSLFFKLLFGFGGQGALKLTQHADGRIEMFSSEIFLTINPAKVDLPNLVNQLITTGYFVQPFLAAKTGYSTGIRCVVRKNERFELMVPGIYAVTSTNTILSQVAHGGTRQNIYEVAPASVVEEIIDISKHAFLQIEQEAAEEAYEFGFDFLYDKDEKIWLLEANSVPLIPVEQCGHACLNLAPYLRARIDRDRLQSSS